MSLTYSSKDLEYVNCNYCGADDTRVVYDFAPLRIVKCMACRLVYTNPRLKASVISNCSYDQDYWQRYEEAHRTGLPAIQQFYRQWLLTLENYAETKCWKLCEVGPGLGVCLSEARNLGHEVYGIELSEYAIEYARRVFDLSTVFLGSADSMEGANLPTLDVVVMFATIEHLHNPLNALVKINNRTVDRGLLLLSTGVYGSFNQIVAGKAWSIIDPEAHLYYFSKRSMRNVLDAAGYEVLDIRTNSTIINPLTKNRGLVKLFNNRFSARLRMPYLTARLGLGDEMFVIARKVRHLESC